MEIFEVWVIEAKNIASKRKSGHVDPYCRLHTNFNLQSYKSIVATKSLVPYWGQCFRFFANEDPPTGNVIVGLYQRTTFFADQSLGEFAIDISAYADGNEHDFWGLLQNEPKKTELEQQGEIHVRLRFLNLEGESPPLTNPIIVSPVLKVTSERGPELQSPELRKSPSLSGTLRRKFKPATTSPVLGRANKDVDAGVLGLSPPPSPPGSRKSTDSPLGSRSASAPVSQQISPPVSQQASPPPQLQLEVQPAVQPPPKSPAQSPSESPAQSPPQSPSQSADKPLLASSVDQAAVLRVEDKYELGQRIGTGAFSAVYKAKNKFTDEEVAIKVINKLSVKSRELEMLSREIKIIKKLKHPNIVRLLDLFDGAQKLYIVLELIPGGELFDRIVESGGYSENDARLLISQVLQGVGYMHKNGVVHRDLKPENLLCIDATHVKIADFGMSKDILDMGNCKTAVGTPNYIAPEIIRGLNKVAYDSACDIWSIGVLTYVLLSGFAPFWGESQKQLFERITKAEFDFPSPEFDHISTNAKDFITRLLTPNPDSRLTAEQALNHVWVKANIAVPHRLTSVAKNLAAMMSQNRAESRDSDELPF